MLWVAVLFCVGWFVCGLGLLFKLCLWLFIVLDCE